MTGRTTSLIVPCMTEPNPKCTRLLRSAHQPSELMTRAARRDVSSIRLRARRVTTETSHMRIQPRGNREPNTATIPPVTSGTSRATVLRVIEARIKAAQRWKRFDLSTLRVCVTDRADRARWI